MVKEKERVTKTFMASLKEYISLILSVIAIVAIVANYSSRQTVIADKQDGLQDKVMELKQNQTDMKLEFNQAIQSVKQDMTEKERNNDKRFTRLEDYIKEGFKQVNERLDRRYPR